ncbi:MAG: L-2-hydroxyglutarate oxidase [Methylacidiphilales bacterium]|nr:L-2-hydroxyglutarate oxidase [Candidatus Methylacidiphilales bacterium]
MKIVIIGGGIVGLAVAYKLLQARPGLQLTLLEKEADVGRHQSTHNSGVLHAGLYYKPGSAKARLAVSGIKQMTRFCQEHGIAHEICGKIVVAVNEEQLPRLRTLLERGQTNGLSGLAWLSPSQIHDREPHAAGLGAVLVPEEGIVDYSAVCHTLSRLIKEMGGKVELNHSITYISRQNGTWRLESSGAEPVETPFIINCAGLHCDRVSRMAGRNPGSRIIPFRGEYYVIRPERAHLVNHLIYPVPDPTYPFLGVHFTRLIHGGIEAGPNAVLALKREGYSRTSFSLRDSIDSLTWPGLWRFATTHAGMCVEELLRSFNKQRFCRSLQELVPDIREEDLSPGGCGVRAQAMNIRGDLLQDFEIVQDDSALHLLNAPSPAATASLAIADELISRIPFKAVS